MFSSIGKSVFFLSACLAALIFSVGATTAATIKSNTKLGKGALASKPTGTDNTAVGFNALHFDTIGFENTAVGSGALQNNIGGTDGIDGNRNTAVGFQALFSNTTGGNNTAVGFGALVNNTTAERNTAVGTAALPTSTTGGQNTAVGYGSLIGNTDGFSNTAVGVFALQSNTSGFLNTAVGLGALLNNTTGDFNTAVGNSANVSSGDLNNATAIGFGAIVNASNKVRIGNGGVTVIEGNVAYTFPSDATKKENFRLVDGEEVLRKIRGFELTSWNFIGHDPKEFRHYGPMAQDFFAAFGHDGVGTIGTPTTINSGDLAGILMSAVQALEKRTGN